MPLWLKWSMIVAAIGSSLWALDRVGLWMESRGWIYWRKIKPRGGASAALGAFREFVQPEIRHVQEEQRQRREARRNETGDPKRKEDSR